MASRLFSIVAIVMILQLLLISESLSFVLGNGKVNNRIINFGREIKKSKGIDKVINDMTLHSAVSGNPTGESTITAAVNEKRKPANKLKVLVYFSLWYFISIFYNIYNKKALTLLKLPWLVATSQMGMGLLIFIPLWILRLREFPANDASEFQFIIEKMSIVSLYQTLTHISGVVALGAGAVSFTQVVKASEPAFTALIAAIFEKQFFSLPVYLTLIPVIAGVSMASVTELTFSWYCLFAGIIANIFAAARGVFGKKQMCGSIRCVEQMSPENYYAILTLISFVMLIPLTLIMEGKSIFKLNLINPQTTVGLQHTLISGILFYLYNEVSFKALDNVHPVTHALANTLKRIVIIISSVLVFNNPITPLGIIGATLAISGVFAYSLAQYYSKQKKKEVKKE